VVGIDFQVSLTAQAEVHCRVLGKEREHVVEEGNPGLYRCFARAIQEQSQRNAGLAGGAMKGGLTLVHSIIKLRLSGNKKRNSFPEDRISVFGLDRPDRSLAAINAPVGRLSFVATLLRW
jgi:hypothetical protein